MTKRHDALLPLTHDHHHALVQARALIGAASADDEERARVARTFLNFYEEDTLLHFHEEEEVLFPRLLEHVEEPPQELLRVLVEHVWIHGAVTRLRSSLERGEPTSDQMKELGETLRAHVRLEESRLFPLIERTVPDPSLSGMSLAPRERGEST